MCDEIWKPVVGFEGYYEVSNHGNVRGVDRVVPMKGSKNGRRTKGRPRKQTPHPNGGHMYVTLCADNGAYTRYVHHLVLEAFVGPRPDGCWALHRDDDQRNNHIDNLYYGTPLENSDDARRNGGAVRGETCGASKMTEAQIAEIKRLAMEGYRQWEIAERMGLRQASVGRIIENKSWAHTPNLKVKQTFRGEERWAKIGIHPDYSVSTWGRIRNDVKGTYLRPTRDPRAGSRTTLPTKPKRTNVSVHVLVFETFVRPLEPGEFCYHINGDGEANYVENLAPTRSKMRSRIAHTLRMMAEAEVGRTLAAV